MILYVNKWAICATVCQLHQEKLHPVRYVGRTLNGPETRYTVAEKEVLALLRVVNTCFTFLVGQELVVYTRFSTLKWLYTGKNLSGRALQWATYLSPWTFRVEKIEKDTDGLAKILSLAITPREHVDELSEELCPQRTRATPAYCPVSSHIPDEFEGHLVSFDGGYSRTHKQGGSAAVLWKLPEWEVVYAGGTFVREVTNNETEYHALLWALKQALEHQITKLIVVGDSNLVIKQVTGMHQCREPHLEALLHQAKELASKFQEIQFVHVVRVFNASADYVAGKTLRSEGEYRVVQEEEITKLKILNKLHEKTVPTAPVSSQAVSFVGGDTAKESKESVYVLTRSRSATAPPTTTTKADVTPEDRHSDSTVDSEPAIPTTTERNLNQPVETTPAMVVAERWRRVVAHQRGDPKLKHLIQYLQGELKGLKKKEVKQLAKIADQYEIDNRGVLLYLSYNSRYSPLGPGIVSRVVVPVSMQSDVLHMCHTDFQSGHQGVNRTFERLKKEYHWIGMYNAVQEYVRSCVDCATGKDRKRKNRGRSPGNLVAVYPFQVISMDFVTDLPASHRGNTRLLLFQCVFSGYNLCKPMSSWSAADVAQAYNEVVFQRYGASSIIRHDREPGFMSQVFTAFRQMMGSQQRATLAYRPQANGQQERAVQTVMRAVKTYVSDPDQRDWDDLAESLMFALNTSYDHTRRETPFFLVHGWDPRNTLTAMLTPTPGGVLAAGWRSRVQKTHEYAIAMARDIQVEVKQLRAEEHNEQLNPSFEQNFAVGDAVWLFMARVKPGLSKKLAHLWHGPFRVVDKKDEFMVKLKLGSQYKFFPWVHTSRLKLRTEFPERPTESMGVTAEGDDLDAALLPEDSWEADEGAGEYEVEAILDVDWYKPTRTSRRTRRYLIKWRGYQEPEWVEASQLNCGRLQYKFDQSEKARARLAAMLNDDTV